MTSSNLQALRICDHAIFALAFSAMLVTALWLGTRRFIGHRKVFIHASFFLLSCSVHEIVLMFNGINMRTGSKLSAALLTTSMLTAFTFATHVLVSLGDLEFTFVDTEAGEMLRQDKRADDQQKHKLFEYMAEQNKQQSVEMLTAASAVRR